MVYGGMVGSIRLVAGLRGNVVLLHVGLTPDTGSGETTTSVATGSPAPGLEKSLWVVVDVVCMTCNSWVTVSIVC